MMTTLHIINSAKTPSALKALTDYFAQGDSVLFIQDGCYNLTGPIPRPDLKCYALEADARARAIVSEHGELIDYEQFVTLSLNCNNSISW